MSRLSLTVCLLMVVGAIANAVAGEPTATDYCLRLQQEIQGKKHGFLAGNLTYYVGGFHASWNLREHETIGLTHPFSHDLRSRGSVLARVEPVGMRIPGWEMISQAGNSIKTPE